MASEAYTWDDKANKEDLLNLLTNISPIETQLVSGLGTSVAKGVNHEWLIKSLGSTKANAYAEGADASHQTLTSPTRLQNVTQISREAFAVSGTERAVDTAGFNDRYQLEATEALEELKNDMELALMNGTLTQSVASTNSARTLRGIKQSLSLVSTAASTVSMLEATFNNYLQLVWDNSKDMVDEVYGDMYMKRKISGFTAGSTKFTKNEDKRLVNTVDVYESDASKVVKLFAHRYVNLSANGGTNIGHDLVGIKNDRFKVAYLRKPFMIDLAKTGDSDKGEFVTEYTLEALNPTSGFWAGMYL